MPSYFDPYFQRKLDSLFSLFCASWSVKPYARRISATSSVFCFELKFVICRDRKERERTPTGYYGAKDFYERYRTVFE